MMGANQPEIGKVAGFALEVWNSLFEEEIENTKNAPADWQGIITRFNWRDLAAVFFNGLGHTGFDDADHTIDDEDEASVSIQCFQALALLA
jgi:hypothetical protein